MSTKSSIPDPRWWTNNNSNIFIFLITNIVIVIWRHSHIIFAGQARLSTKSIHFSYVLLKHQHRRIHKAAWASPDLQTENQIDRMCIGKRFRRTLQDVRVRRGADVAWDHHLLVAQLKLKLSRNLTGRTNQCLGYNTFLLNDTNKREELSITLSNKFEVLQELMEEETIDVRWQRVKGAVTSTYNEVLGLRNPNHNG